MRDWIRYITRKNYNYTVKAWCNHRENSKWFPNYIFMSLQWFIHFYGQDKFIYIVSTHSFLSSEHIHYVPINDTYLVSIKVTLLVLLNITNNCPEYLNGGFVIITYPMDIIRRLPQKMVQILLEQYFPCFYSRKASLSKPHHTLTYTDKYVEVTHHPNKSSP